MQHWPAVQSTPPPKKKEAQQPPIFDPCLLWPSAICGLKYLVIQVSVIYNPSSHVCSETNFVTVREVSVFLHVSKFTFHRYVLYTNANFMSKLRCFSSMILLHNIFDGYAFAFMLSCPNCLRWLVNVMVGRSRGSLKSRLTLLLRHLILFRYYPGQQNMNFSLSRGLIKIVVGLIKNFTDRSKETIILLYKNLIRPYLEYCCPVWNPHYMKYIKLVEGVQRRATKLVFTEFTDASMFPKMMLA